MLYRLSYCGIDAEKIDGKVTNNLLISKSKISKCRKKIVHLQCMISVGEYSGTDKMRDVVADSPMLLMALSRFGIPLGFSDDSVDEVCRRSGVHTPTFLAVASLVGRKVLSEGEISLSALMDYLKKV